LPEGFSSFTKTATSLANTSKTLSFTNAEDGIEKFIFVVGLNGFG